LQLLEENLVQTQTPATTNEGDFWLRAVVNPCTYALHAAQLPDEAPSRRRRHALEGLIFKLQDGGLNGLSTREKRSLISHRDGLHELHTLLWSNGESPLSSIKSN
ncbi:MAG: glucans biosynthesis glucosyltransferase MdoH, partial [Chromatium okenii]|nr:glucans biosynthesis glucosyltransferase MdoH [Chromatium okenii]